MTTVMLNPRICKFRGHIILFRDKYGENTLKEESYSNLGSVTTLEETIDLNSGWYEVLIRLENTNLEEENKLIWQDPFPLRIITGQETTGTLTLTKDDLFSDEGFLELELKMEKPFSVTLNDRYNGRSLAIGDLYSLVPRIDGEDFSHDQEIQYRWYINGEIIAHSGLALDYHFETEGIYIVSLIVLKDGALGKASAVVNITTPIELKVDEEFTAYGDDFVFLINKLNDEKDYVLELNIYNRKLNLFNIQWPPAAEAREPNDGDSQPERFIPMQHHSYTNDNGIYFIGKLDKDILFNFYTVGGEQRKTIIKIREALPTEIPKTISFRENETTVFEHSFNIQDDAQIIPLRVKNIEGKVSNIQVEYSSEADLSDYINRFKVSPLASHTYNKGYSGFGATGGNYSLELGIYDVLETLIIEIPAKGEGMTSEEIEITITLN